MIDKKYRHEFKYVSPEYILTSQQIKISTILKLDKHVGQKGKYSIRSIYFDDIYNTCYFENEDGTDPREKFRIRIYNCNKDRICLELKQKEKGMCHKISCPISYQTCLDIMQGKIPEFNKETSYLLKKLISQMQFRALKPVVIVAYERVPFVYKDGNVRITFDRNLRSSNNILGFFDENLPFRSIFPVETNMMEVKFDELLPDFINKLLQTTKLQWTSFSKYYLCRKFDFEGKKIIK